MPTSAPSPADLPEPDLELTVAARADNVGVVRHVLTGVGTALDLHPEVLDDVRLAVSEACANAVVHAYAGRTPGLMTISVVCGADDVTIAVRDHGCGMSPRHDSPGLGVGLPLIASLARSMELTAPSGGGTEVRMTFAIRSPELELYGSSDADASDAETGR